MANFINQNINSSARESDGQEPAQTDHEQGASNGTAASPQEVSEYHNIDDVVNYQSHTNSPGSTQGLSIPGPPRSHVSNALNAGQVCRYVRKS